MADRVETEILRPAHSVQAADKPALVFISYASADKLIADAVCAVLEPAGIPCWVAPRDVRPGALYADAIVRAINNSKALVLVLSGHSIASSHVGKEVERASSKRRPIISLRLDAAPLTPALEYFLSESQWIDATSANMDAACGKLIQAIRDPCDSAPGVASTGDASPKQALHPTLMIAAIVVALLSVTTLIASRFFVQRHASTILASATSISGERSIAVMPFSDLSESKDQGYFADGLAEELVDVLGRLPELLVIGHASSFQLRGKSDDAHVVGTQLGAAHLVEGSVRRSGDNVRVTVQLISARDGAREWSGTFDRRVDDLLQVQTEIAMSLGRALQLSISGLQTQRSAATTNAEAYDLYLRALHANDQFSDEGFREAISYLQRAIDLDPTFVRAYEALASTHLLQAVFGTVPSNTGFAIVRDDAQRLLKLDPASGWGQTLLCRFHTEYSWDWPEAERQCASALLLAPRFWLALYAAADLALIQGDYAKSERLFRDIFPIDPLNADAYMELGLTLRAVGRFAEAEAAFRHGLAITPKYVTGHMELGSVLLAEDRVDDALKAFALEAPDYGQQAGLAMAYHMRGSNPESASALQHFVKDHGNQQPTTVAEAYSFLGNPDQAFDWLERAYRQKDPLMPYIKGDWLMKGLEEDPRYKTFLRKLNLPE